jgi:ATP-binding protein involved in chromosome partitioning
MIDKKTVMKELKKVIDPEIGLPITDMQLIDDIKIDKGNVMIKFHLTNQFCPLASNIASEIKNHVSKLKGVKSVKLKLIDHSMAEEINSMVNNR